MEKALDAPPFYRIEAEVLMREQREKERRAMDGNRFEPKIIAFLCNWCAYGAADLAGVSRLQYPPNVRPVRVMCSATVSPHHILRAFQSGADGVLVGG